MIPLRSSEPTYTFPAVTLLLIAINILVFLFEITLPEELQNIFLRTYGLVPDRLHVSALLTSMFLHGGWLHIAGNMWFLWIFGKGIEDLLGHGRFLVFYLLCGLAAGLVDVVFNYYSTAPTVGASGAIAGVMGAYLVKFPRARIVTLVWVFIFITSIDIPAAFLLAYWFLIQLFSGVGSVGESHISRGPGVAWFAHVGGFLAGIALIWMMPARQRYRSWS